MRTDAYTKIVLTIIALMLTLTACRGVLTPERTVAADGPFAGVQFSGGGSPFVFFDNKTGEIWAYYAVGYPVATDRWEMRKFRITKLGDPIVKVNDPFTEKGK